MFGSCFYFIVLLICATEIDIVTDLDPTDTTKQTVISDKKNQEQLIQEITPTIVITNNIDNAMLGYKHWTGTYTPDVFTVSINDTEVSSGQSYTVNNTNDPIKVTCHYSFMNGMRSGDKTVFYRLDKEYSTANLTFSWLEPHKILIDNASLLQETT
jgi:hypothetical protein